MKRPQTSPRGPAAPAGTRPRIVSPPALSSRPQPRGRPRRIIAVGGGKGGIGKSLVSSSLGIELARRGHRTLLVDADLGGANLHTCLGVDPPKVTLSDLLTREANSVAEVMVPTGVPNLSLVSGAFDSLDVANPKQSQKQRLLKNLQSADVDFLLLDLGAGSTTNVLDFFLIADHGLLVLVPEPTSIENGYRFIKAAFFRRLAAAAGPAVEPLVREAMSRKQENGIKTPLDVIAAVKRRNASAGASLEREMLRFKPGLIINQTRTPADRQMGQAVVAAWRKYFGLQMDYLGAIGYDDEVWKAVRKRKPVVVDRPDAETARSVAGIADRLLELDAPSSPLAPR